MEYIILLISILLFAASLLLLFYCRRTFIRFTSELTESLDKMIGGKEEIIFKEEHETLSGKIQGKLRRLYEILREQAAQNQKEKELLEKVIADLSHQVKTPIASIRMYQEFLKKEQLEKKRRQEFLYAMEGQVDKLEFLIKSMIKISRFQVGLIKIRREYTFVYPMLERVVCDAALGAEAKNIHISVDCNKDRKAFFDSKWTEEALFNLVDNAVKYTEVGGNIKISAEATDFFVRVCVEDNGRGIQEEHLPLVFQRFYREPEVAKQEGVGIGLTLAREILNKQKGFVDVRSTEGKGSAFSIHLPLEES